MPNIIFNIPLYFTGITTCIYTELAPKLTATTSVAQSVERWSRDPGSWVQFPAGGWLLEMYIFLTLEFTVLSIISSVDNECKCQLLSLMYKKLIC